MKQRIQALLDKDCYWVIIETYSSQIINIMHDHPQEDYQFLLIILKCKSLLTNFWQSTATYVLRIFNKCADVLAKLRHNVKHEEMVWIDVISPLVVQVLAKDIICS